MHPPLVIVELLLHEEQVGFELVPLEDDVAHLLLGEARLVGILVVAGWLGRRLGGFAMLAGLMGREREKHRVHQTRHRQDQRWLGCQSDPSRIPNLMYQMSRISELIFFLFFFY